MRNKRAQIAAEVLRDAGIMAFQNACQLVREADLLFEHSHYARTVFLCFISAEELGKSFISLSAVVNRRTGIFDQERYLVRFRNHRQKTRSLFHFENLFVCSTPDQPAAVDADSDRAEMIKLNSLYSDFYGQRVCAPSQIITEEVARPALLLAKDRVRFFEERVRPKFDHVLELDEGELKQVQREFLESVGIDVSSEENGKGIHSQATRED